MTRIFEVETEIYFRCERHWTPNWSRRRVAARTAAEAIRRVERQENSRNIRAVGVKLVAETET